MKNNKKRRPLVYIAGPITGVDKYWEAFEKAEDELEAAGFAPLSPSRLPSHLTKAQAMPICLAMINAADAVLFLPGYDNSVGARLEKDYCIYINKPAYLHIEALKSEWTNKPKTRLDLAYGLIAPKIKEDIVKGYCPYEVLDLDRKDFDYCGKNCGKCWAQPIEVE